MQIVVAAGDDYGLYCRKIHDYSYDQRVVVQHLAYTLMPRLDNVAGYKL